MLRDEIDPATKTSTKDINHVEERFSPAGRRGVVRGCRRAVRLERVWGAKTSVGSAELWLLACLAPPAVMLLVWRAPTQTVAEVLYDATHPKKDGRS